MPQVTMSAAAGELCLILCNSSVHKKKDFADALVINDNTIHCQRSGILTLSLMVASSGERSTHQRTPSTKYDR
jgi:hypothetical protein